jgi:hypothetical protein
VVIAVVFVVPILGLARMAAILAGVMTIVSSFPLVCGIPTHIGSPSLTQTGPSADMAAPAATAFWGAFSLFTNTIIIS